jgi:hypothetical protein
MLFADLFIVLFCFEENKNSKGSEMGSSKKQGFVYDLLKAVFKNSSFMLFLGLSKAF